MKIYIASPLSNSTFNAFVAERLEAHGWICFLPQRDAQQTDKKESIVSRNTKAIFDADLIVLITRKIGIDTAWEAGFAAALSKPIVILDESSEAIHRSHMLKIGSKPLRVVDNVPNLEMFIDSMGANDGRGATLVQ